MFDNIGGKIKNLATVICVIGIIASVILAIALWSQNERYNPTVALGFGVLIGGCVGSWVGSFFMYGFGQLIEDTSAIRELLKNGAESKVAPVENVQKEFFKVPVEKKNTSVWECPKCLGYNSSEVDKCQYCGKSKE